MGGYGQRPETNKNKHMNTSKLGLRLISALMVFSMVAFVTSCTEEDPIAFSDKQSVSSEANMDSYFEDAEDISFTVSVATDEEINGRIAGVNDDRLACEGVTVSLSGDENQRTITIDFGEGCTRNEVTRKGKIIITYTGPRFTVGSSISITFDGYYINDVKIEGTRTVEISEITNTSITHEITLANGKITWPDNSTATRNAHHFRKWDWKGDLIRLNDEVSLLEGGTAEGTNRNEKSYTMQITADIVFKAECFATRRFLPVSGEKILEVNGRVITVNYGSGDCDNTITVTVDGGESVEVTVNRE